MKPIAIAELISALFIAASIVSLINKEDKSKSVKWLRFSMSWALIYLVIDSMAYTLTGPDYPFVLRYIINLLAYSSGMIVIIAFLKYSESYISEKTSLKKWTFIFPLIFALICIITTCCEFFMGHLVVYENEIAVQVNDFPVYLRLMYFVPMLFTPVLTIIKRKELGLKAVFLLGLYNVVPLIASAVAIFTGVDLTAILGAISIILVANILHKDTIQNSLRVMNDKLANANSLLAKELRRSDALNDIVRSGKWTFYLNRDDEIIGSDVSNEANEIIHNSVAADGHSWVNIVHPEEKDYAWGAFMATIKDHSCQTPYDVNYRMLGEDGKYRWFHSAGRVIRDKDGNGEFFGVHVDITDQMEEQQTRLLGAIPLSSDILNKANIGLWAFELDEGQPPRMYDDEAMLRLVGLDHQVPPEETYHAWYDHIDEGSYDLVTDAVNKMMTGEHAEVQYPWHYPDGRTIIVRCGGIRNFEYTKGIRIEGTHQDVSKTLHYDEEERRKAKLLENELIISKLRADSLAYIADNEPDLENAINFFGKRILEISKCDQVVFREENGRKFTINAPGIESFPEETCKNCPFEDMENDIYDENGTVVIDNYANGFRGLVPPPTCPAKSSIGQRVYSGDKIVGLFSINYFTKYHTFTDDNLAILKTVAMYCGILLERLNAKKAEIEKIEAESSNKAKSEFLFSMSHDIRTPMNAIIGFTDQAIKHEDDKEALDSALNKVKSSSSYLLRIVNDILDMAKIESGKLDIKEEVYCITKDKASLVDVFEADAERKGIDFQASDNIQDEYIWVDENRINQIVANLVSNSIKYTKAGGKIWCNVDQVPCEKDGYGKYLITVKDTGCGMSQEFLTKIFDAFERDNYAKESGAQGTGLGMAIVKRLVDALGATIDIQSELGKGTTTTITVINKIATKEEIDQYINAANQIAQNSNYNFKGKKVLLVEDNELNREIATDILEEEGLIVEEASDGAKAVKALEEKGIDYYDFVLMDIQMPFMNGYEATKEIRKLYPDAKLPIIALSANAFDEDKATSIAAGMDDHIAKPINVKELFNALSKFI